MSFNKSRSHRSLMAVVMCGRYLSVSHPNLALQTTGFPPYARKADGQEAPQSCLVTLIL